MDDEASMKKFVYYSIPFFFVLAMTITFMALSDTSGEDMTAWGSFFVTIIVIWCFVAFGIHMVIVNRRHKKSIGEMSREEKDREIKEALAIADKHLYLQYEGKPKPDSPKPKVAINPADSIFERQDFVTGSDEGKLRMGYSVLGASLEVVARIGHVEKGQVNVSVSPGEVKVLVHDSQGVLGDAGVRMGTVQLPVIVQPNSALAEIWGDALIVTAKKSEIALDPDSPVVEVRPIVKG